ncbi:helix-turn-helix domain-containing protein (plasmid) [Kozakia baliensis]|uniref:helix-turn-helix domain-containing protein n=1 Tax=Kozakia baliensis TaxID=153496 RepID=UPI00345BF6DA
MTASFASQLWTLTQARQISGRMHLVLQALASFTGLHGTFPAHETIAARAGCSVRTVIRALERAYELGIVERTRRMVRHGKQLVRTSNAYRFMSGSQEQAKASAVHFAEQMRKALKRRKQRLFDLSDKMSAKQIPLFNFNSLNPVQAAYDGFQEALARLKGPPLGAKQ